MFTHTRSADLRGILVLKVAGSQLSAARAREENETRTTVSERFYGIKIAAAHLHLAGGLEKNTIFDAFSLGRALNN
jgi:hypothetical protein